MANGKAEIYELSSFTTSSGVVNYESLEMEIRASAVNGLISADGIKGKCYIHFPTALTEDEIILLDDIVSSHDGVQSRTTQALQTKRSALMSSVIGRAYNHPVLKNFPNEINGYTTTIDDEINAWIRDGNETALVTRIYTDSLNTEGDFYNFLNRVVNYEGNKTFEYLISEIPTTPFI